MGKLMHQYYISMLIICWALVLMYTAAEREYFLQDRNLTWDDARNYCQICYKDLVTLTPDNSLLITEKLNSDHWIGLRKKFNSTNNSSVSWSLWANGDPLFFQNWYPGWPVFKSPPPKVDCCSCSCTCPANPATETTSSPPVTENVTDLSSFFDPNMTNLDNIWEPVTGNTTSSSGPSYTTSASPLKIEAACERSPMPVTPETNENDSYIEDSCVAMLSFGPWVEKSCLEPLPFICYEDRFFGQVNVTDVNLTNATLAWESAPGNITHYRLEINGGDLSYNLSTLTYDLDELIPGSRYEVQVFPVKCKRDLNPQNATFYTVPSKVTNLTVTNVTETSVTLSWNEPEGSLDFYFVKYENEKELYLASNQTIHQVGSLIPGGLYTFTILTGVQDKSRWSEESSVTTNTKPGKVSGLTVSDNTKNSLLLNWIAPEGKFTGFRVMALGTNSTLFSKEVDQGEHGVRVEPLPSGSRISLSVTTLANYTTSPDYTALAPEGDEETTEGYTAPEPISNLTLSTDESSLIASWSKPEGNYSLFIVMLTLDGKTEEKETINAMVKFDGLKNAAYYTVTVQAVSGDIKGPPVSSSKYTRPSAPTNARAISNATSSAITFQWDPPANVATANYSVKLSSSIRKYNTTEETKLTSHTLYNLTSGTKYYFEVSALAGEHESLPAKCSHTTVPKKVEISLAMLCTSATPLLCDDDASKEKITKKLREYFNKTLGDNIFWEFPKQ